MSKSSVDEKLAVDTFEIDQQCHIMVNETICKGCEHLGCVYVCPADCYKMTQGHLTFSYEGCLECGSCRIACPRGAIEWAMPRAGLGVCFVYG